jgi:hypothetical protein
MGKIIERVRQREQGRNERYAREMHQEAMLRQLEFMSKARNERLGRIVFTPEPEEATAWWQFWK